MYRMDVSAPSNITVVDRSGAIVKIADFLATADLIINGFLQDTDRPAMFLKQGELPKLKKDSLIIDISCDAGMGFYFSKPTSFSKPVFNMGQVAYYAVDHTPSYLWRSASWEISKALCPFLATVAGNPSQWVKCPTISRAIDIRDGVIINKKILTFQKRKPEYPHNAV